MCCGLVQTSCVCVGMLCLSPCPECSAASLRYITAEIYLNKGVRVSGEVGGALSSKLKLIALSKTADDNGW